MDYSIIGREAPSTCEHLDIEKVAHWINDIQMPTVDEEGISICSGGKTNEDILKLVYGKLGTSTTDLKEKRLDDNEISTGICPYLSESVVFYSNHKSDSGNVSTKNDDNFQATLDDNFGQENTQDAATNKYDVKSEQISYKQATPGPDRGCCGDYNAAQVASMSHQDSKMTVPPNCADTSVYGEAKQSEDNDGMPYVPSSEDTGAYSTSGFSGISLPPPDEGYTVIHPDDKITSRIPAVTSSASTISQHSDQSMPFGDYLD